MTQRQLVNHLRGNQRNVDQKESAARSASFGLLAQFSSKGLVEAIEKLVEAEYLAYVDDDNFHLQVSMDGTGLLAGKPLRGIDLRPERGVLGRSPAIEEHLFELRRRIAREENRPAFSIFCNATLADLAADPPKNVAAMAEIDGMGERRLSKYGRRILNALRKAERIES